MSTEQEDFNYYAFAANLEMERLEKTFNNGVAQGEARIKELEAEVERLKEEGIMAALKIRELQTLVKKREAEVEQLKAATCTWTWNDEYCYWDGSCGASMCPADEPDLKKNQYNFCPKCGAKIIEVNGP